MDKSHKGGCGRQVSELEIGRQLDYIRAVKQKNDDYSTQTGKPRRFYCDTYGCQQNEADSESIKGMALEMGYELTNNENEADLLMVNTCAVRSHAEQRVLGNVGALSHAISGKRGAIIGICGCMVTQPHMREKIKNSYPYVRLLFNTHALWRFPELLLRVMETGKRVFETPETEGQLAEGLPKAREGQVKAYLPVMSGCNNFCTYCVVPYVRGRERSRAYADIRREAEELVLTGYREITLLGQNVNSYGLDLDDGMDFPSLLESLNEIEGNFSMRFMTSHPKDASSRLFDVMAAGQHIAKGLHLPVQSGSDRVLAAMNRRYTSGDYLNLIEYARKVMPGLVITSDIIVGFPGESAEDFEATLELVRRVRFDSLFTFIYSKREGTPAASMEDPTSREEKQARFDRLLTLQNQISLEINQSYVGQTLTLLVDGVGREGNLTSRTNGGKLVHLSGGNAKAGEFVNGKITSASPYALYAEII